MQVLETWDRRAEEALLNALQTEIERMKQQDAVFGVSVVPTRDAFQAFHDYMRGRHQILSSIQDELTLDDRRDRNRAIGYLGQVNEGNLDPAWATIDIVTLYSLMESELHQSGNIPLIQQYHEENFIAMGGDINAKLGSVLVFLVSLYPPVAIGMALISGDLTGVAIDLLLFPVLGRVASGTRRLASGARRAISRIPASVGQRFARTVDQLDEVAVGIERQLDATNISGANLAPPLPLSLTPKPSPEQLAKHLDDLLEYARQRFPGIEFEVTGIYPTNFGELVDMLEAFEDLYPRVLERIKIERITTGILEFDGRIGTAAIVIRTGDTSRTIALNAWAGWWDLPPGGQPPIQGNVPSSILPGGYSFGAAISHEFGHIFHDWLEMEFPDSYENVGKLLNENLHLLFEFSPATQGYSSDRFIREFFAESFAASHFPLSMYNERVQTLIDQFLETLQDALQSARK